MVELVKKLADYIRAISYGEMNTPQKGKPNSSCGLIKFCRTSGNIRSCFRKTREVY